MWLLSQDHSDDLQSVDRNRAEWILRTGRGAATVAWDKPHRASGGRREAWCRDAVASSAAPCKSVQAVLP